MIKLSGAFRSLANAPKIISVCVWLGYFPDVSILPAKRR
jgi:hypothetical protein